MVVEMGVMRVMVVMLVTVVVGEVVLGLGVT